MLYMIKTVNTLLIGFINITRTNRNNKYNLISNRSDKNKLNSNIYTFVLF